MKLWGKTYTKTELMKHVGDLSQICGIRRSVLDDGPGRGMRLLEADTGGGLRFSVLPDRGMDISHCQFKSIPLGFISKTGPMAPGLCRYDGDRFLRYFTAGLLTTCGYTHMGAACTDEGKPLGMHGYATALVSDNTSSEGYWQDDAYIMRMTGTLREAKVFAENIQFKREIMVTAGENRIQIHDTAENCGFDAQPFMLLYHFNFGHPLVGPDTALFTSGCKKSIPRDETAAKGLSCFHTFESPTHGYAEQVFYHDLIEDENGAVFAGLRNTELGLSARVKFFKRELPYLIEWKQMGEGDYTCGLEPATWKPEGRDRARAEEALEYIQPGEVKTFHLEVSIDSV